jgi:hypothetical protein
MPSDLQKLMRHESVETLRYYVGRDSETLSDILYAAVESEKATLKSNKTGNKRPNYRFEGAEEKPQILAG